ncbi:integrase core domain-containing protein [bacterium]|nr:integrase core domain-containing protein [bacterium]
MPLSKRCLSPMQALVSTALPNCSIARRNELLNREIFLILEEACWVIDRWRLDYNHHRIQSSLDDQTPAACAAGCVPQTSATPQQPENSRFTNPNSLTQAGAKTEG